MYSVSLVSRFINSSTENYLFATKRIFRYLKGTIDYKIFYAAGTKGKLIDFSDSNFAGDLNDGKVLLNLYF